MAEYTQFLRGPATAPIEQIGTQLISAENIIDFSLVLEDIVIGDTFPVITLPANAVVKEVTCICDLLGGAAQSVDVGDELTDNGWIGIMPLTVDNVIRSSTGPLGGIYDTNGKHYEEAEQKIIMTARSSIDNAKVWIAVEYYIAERIGE